MIARIKGNVVELKDLAVIIDAGGIFYEVSIPASVAQRLSAQQGQDGVITLVTHHYYQMTPSSATPILVGFLNDLEKDFFLQFISVSGIGPKAAVKALDRSISEIASAIDKGDIAYLKTLPGIGQQKARDIVAKLQGKVSRFGLIPDAGVKRDVSVSVAFKDEAIEVLMQLQYKKSEAEAMVAKVLERNSSICSTEELLNTIYTQKAAR
ncbi:MAG: Holliday junction branch migration protein RuvA [Candidatus Omnitrophica bacterium]|nr:Holliday junction branch migration protein RuvA [Candidatus Omnitrophota bacterium]